MAIANDRAESPSSRELLTAAKKGEAEAFCALLQPFEDRLFKQAVSLCRNHTQAEDLVAETWIEAWKSLPNYNESCRLSTWLYAILVHRYQKSIRRAGSRPVGLSWLSWFEADQSIKQQENLPAMASTPSEAMAQDEIGAQLRRAIDALPEKHQQVILLRFFEDASSADIAASLGCSVGTVKSRLHHALEKLRKMKMNLSELRRDT